jgi:hypothetical protein
MVSGSGGGATYDYPLTGSPPITETHAQGDPGVDWGVPTGTPVYAIASGTVIQVGAPGYGPYYVEIDHGGQIQSFYGHNSQALVHVGDKVAQGQEIALSGNLGNSTGPHLELGIKVNGQLVDPVSFLQEQGGRMPTGTADPLSASQSAAGGSSQWTAAQIASSFGLSDALFKSNPELAKVLQTAVAEQLTPDTAQGQADFQALLQSTNWYKQRTDAQRKWQLLSTADPAEARQQFVSALGNVIHTAASLGVPLTTNQEWLIAGQAASLNLTADEVKFAIAAKLKQTPSGQYGGDAGQLADDLRSKAQSYGMPLSAADVGKAVFSVMNGHASEEDYLNHFKNYATSMFPGAASAIASGKTLADVAQPYLSTYQSVLEQNPNTVDLSKDPTIRKALAYQAPEQTNGAVGKTGTPATPAEPTTQPLWQFEQSLKSDPRWMGTDNAQQALTGAGVGVLKQLGLTA